MEQSGSRVTRPTGERYDKEAVRDFLSPFHAPRHEALVPTSADLLSMKGGY